MVQLNVFGQASYGDWSPYGAAPAIDDHPAPSPNPNLVWNAGRYWLYSNLYHGRVHLPPPGTIHPYSGQAIETYLIRHPKEAESEFQVRQQNAFELNFPKEIVRLIVGTIFRQPAVRDRAAEALAAQFQDIDLRGTPAREFVRRAFTRALIFGWVAAVTDSPPAGQSLVTRYDEQVEGRRPWSVVVDPLHLWDWRIDPVTGRFRYALIWLGEKRWKVWYPDSWAILGDTGQVETSGPHELGSVPIDILAPDPVDDDDLLSPFGTSAEAGIAGLALHVYQMGSLLEEHEREALFSILHIKRDPPTAKASERATAPDLHLSSGHYIWTPSDVAWVVPPSTVPQEAREQITWAAAAMRQIAGVATRTEESTEAHSGAALVWESADKHSMIHDLGQAAEVWEVALYRRHGRILGVDVPPDCVRYPEDYILETAADEVGELQQHVQVFGGWEQVPAWARPYLVEKYRRVVVKDLGHLPTLGDLLGPIDAEIASSLRPKVEEAEPVDPRTALNGAQVASMLSIAIGVATGQIPKTSAVEMIVAAFPVDRETASRIIDDVQPSAAQPAPAGAPVAAPTTPPDEQDEEGEDDQPPR